MSFWIATNRYKLSGFSSIICQRASGSIMSRQKRVSGVPLCCSGSVGCAADAGIPVVLVQRDGLCQRAHVCPCTGDGVMAGTKRSLSSVVRGTNIHKEGSFAPIRNAMNTILFLHMRASHPSSAPCCDATTTHEATAGCERSRMPAAVRSLRRRKPLSGVVKMRQTPC